jgi:hypothetical protein
MKSKTYLKIRHFDYQISDYCTSLFHLAFFLSHLISFTAVRKEHELHLVLLRQNFHIR